MNITPINPDGPEYADSRDHAEGGYSLTQLEAMLRDRDNQPEWRDRADTNVAYYDGPGQMTELQRQQMIAEGLEPRYTNLIGRVINGVLGQEAKARSDIKVESDDDETADVVDVLNPAMKEAQRETYADMAVSNGYGSQVKAGVGFVEVARNADPLDYPYRVADVHRNEMAWDWRAKDYLLRDARWMTRSRWQDLDELEAAMPQFKQVLRNVASGWNGFVFNDFDNQDELTSRLRLAFDRENSFRVNRTEWLELNRKRIKMYEVWYKVPAEAIVMHLGPTRRVLFDETNPLHVQAVSRGLVKLTKSLTRQVRMALYAGPHRLQDIGTTRRNFPYIPFFAFRDDDDLTPYGLIEGMRSPQDEYNERRQRIQWMLKAKQITVDNDALDEKFNTFQDLADEAMRPDMMLVLKAQRTNANAIRIGNDLSLQGEQVQVMQDAKQLIQDVPGVYSSQLGNAPSGVTSGVANSLLIEQGAVAMGELNDNYRTSRRAVFEGLLELLIEDHAEPDLQVMVGRGTSRRVVVLNTFDPKSQQLINQVKDAQVRVGLSDVPATAAFRMQQQQNVATIISALGNNPQAVAVLTPSFIESSDLPNRLELADDLRRATGQPTSGDREAAKRQQGQAQQAGQAAQALQQANAQADVALKQAKVNLEQAKADEIQQRTGIAAHGAALQLAQAAQAQQQPMQPEQPAQPAPMSEEQRIKAALAEAQ